MSAPPSSPADRRREAGFTLIELSIVMSIIGLLSLSVFASMENFRQYVYRTSCVQQQRNMVSPAILYGYEHGLSDDNVNCSVLLADNLITRNHGECPLSRSVDYDDYTLWYQGGEFFDVDCDVEGLRHPYTR